MITKRELKERHGVSEEELADLEISADGYDKGEWPEGQIRVMGRPCLYDEKMKSITYRDTVEIISRMDDRAASLNMSRSDYLRDLVRRDLATA